MTDTLRTQDRRRLEQRLQAALEKKMAPTVAPPRMKDLAKKLTAEWEPQGVTFGTGYGLLSSLSKKPQWMLYAWCKDLNAVTSKLPADVEGFPVVARPVPKAV